MVWEISTINISNDKEIEISHLDIIYCKKYI